MNASSEATQSNLHLRTLQLRNKIILRDEASNRTPSTMDESNKPINLKLKPFNPAERICISTWLRYFDQQCSFYDLSPTWKLTNIVNYLHEEAFNFVIENSSNNSTYDEITAKLILRYKKQETNHFQKFTALTLKEGDEIQEFFFKKVDLARLANIPDHIILESLMDSSPPRLRQFMRMADVETPPDWLAAALKIWPDIKADENNFPRRLAPTPRLTIASRNQFHHAEGRAPRISGPAMPDRRSDQLQSNRIHNQGSRNDVPPYPCRICSQRGIPRQLHFHKECPYLHRRDANQEPNTEPKTSPPL